MSSSVHAKVASSRAVYVSHLRRAFLLRVHPDRFRNHSDDVRQSQSALVKALSNRLSQPDFLSWQLFRSPSFVSLYEKRDNNRNDQNNNGMSYPFIIEKRDGSLLNSQLNLSEAVDEILKQMANTLKTSGVANLPLPPLEKSKKEIDNNRTSNEHTHHDDNNIGINSMYNNINRQFDKVSNRGRNLKLFLEETGNKDTSLSSLGGLSDMIQERRLNRMDAQALALTVRKTFQFQSVDAIHSCRSSSSVAVLFRRLLDVYQEHSNDFHVKSFYPLRLVFKPTEFIVEKSLSAMDFNWEGNSRNYALDVYGGILQLHPAWTSLQWLEAIQSVTPENLEAIKVNRRLSEHQAKIVTAALGIKIQKGHSCSSWEYHSFLNQLASSITSSAASIPTEKSIIGLTTIDSSIALRQDTAVIATVESSDVVRSASVSREGRIWLSSNMDASSCLSAIENLLTMAQNRAASHEKEKQNCKNAQEKIQLTLGLQKIYSASPNLKLNQFYQSLLRLHGLLNNLHDEKEVDASVVEFIKSKLSGNSLGIASEGQFCHLADDGSIVIPFDWMYNE